LGTSQTEKTRSRLKHQKASKIEKFLVNWI